jgi:hypothetical protein
MADTSAETVTPTWRFDKHGAHLTLRREQIAGTWTLVLDDGSPRVVRFDDFSSLVVFQNDMEAFLVRTGWSLAAFSPDRRRGRDRRGFPREATDRRRWWTDVFPR